MYVCMGCLKPSINRHNTLFHNGKEVCKTKKCFGEIVHIDELIAPTIIELCRKGYETNFCCSGHWYERLCGTYIYFKYGYAPISEAPTYLKWDDGDLTKPTVRFDPNYIEEFNEDKYNFIIKINQELYKWAVNLPDNNE